MANDDLPEDKIPAVEMTEKEIIQFAFLFNNHYRTVYHYAYGLAKNASDAEDITQVTFVRAWVGWPAFADKGTSSAEKVWLYKIAYNLYIDRFVRGTGRHHNVRLDDPIEGTDGTITLHDTLQGESLGDDTGIERIMVVSFVRGWLAILASAPISFGLQPDDIAMFKAHHLEGNDLEEIAEAYDVTKDIVKEAIARVEREMRKAYVNKGLASQEKMDRVAFDAAFDELKADLEHLPPDGIARHFMAVFAAYYSAANRSLALTQMEIALRHGVALGTINMWIHRVRIRFCPCFDQRHTAMVDKIEARWKVRPTPDWYTRREELFLEHRGFKFPKQGATRRAENANNQAGGN